MRWFLELEEDIEATEAAEIVEIVEVEVVAEVTDAAGDVTSITTTLAHNIETSTVLLASSMLLLRTTEKEMIEFATNASNQEATTISMWDLVEAEEAEVDLNLAITALQGTNMLLHTDTDTHQEEGDTTTITMNNHPATDKELTCITDSHASTMALRRSEAVDLKNKEDHTLKMVTIADLTTMHQPEVVHQEEEDQKEEWEVKNTTEEWEVTNTIEEWEVTKTIEEWEDKNTIEVWEV
jgi:hypothetical protein